MAPETLDWDAIVASVENYDSIRSAAAAMGIPYSTLQLRVSKARKAAAPARTRGTSEIPAPVPAPAPHPKSPVSGAGLPQMTPEMLTFMQAMAAVFQQCAAGQGVASPMTVPAGPAGNSRFPGPELVRGVQSRREARASRKKDDKQEKPLFGGTYASPASRIRKLQGRRFFVTSAQNNTAPHEGFLESIATWCSETGGELIIGPFSYNKNGWYQPFEEKDKCWYDPRIEPFLVSDYCEIAPGLAFCGQINTLPTAVDPLSGFEDFSRGRSGIFPHAKQNMKSMPALKGKPERFLYTTGCCTLSNYLQKKSGQKAEFHHIIGGLIVEIDDAGDWWVRQVNAMDDGSFQDFRTVYTPTGTRPGRVAAITWGDWHIEKEDEEITEVCIGPGGILDVLEPEEQHHHDLLDFTPRNHHNLKDTFFLAEMAWAGSDLVEDGIKASARLLRSAHRPWCKQVLMVSNHCEAFEKWLREADGHKDPNPDNQLYWLEWRRNALLAKKRGDRDYSVFEAAVRVQAPDLERVVFLRPDESYVICEEYGGGIECSIHGHVGVNGAKGSPKGYRGLGIRLNTDHTHSPGIIDGTYTGGVNGKKDMGYNRGPGSWSHSEILTYENSKRTILTIKNGRWRA